MNVECEVECEKFSSGAFRDAFHVTTKQGEKWVLKKYNGKATETTLNTLKSTVENRGKPLQKTSSDAFSCKTHCQ